VNIIADNSRHEVVLSLLKKRQKAGHQESAAKVWKVRDLRL
jgi:hypothetical protein